MRVGLIYDVFGSYPWRENDPPDADAEYEPEETVETLEKVVRHIGHTPVRVGPAEELRRQLCEGLELDAAINISEGARTRNREAHAPILLEMAGVPCLGSDALTLSLSLDKAWTKDLATAAGVRTPAHQVYASGQDVGEVPGPFPLFVKPRYEGTSKGILPQSKVDDRDTLRAEVERITTTYAQDALVERFIEGGGEFTVGVIGNDPPEPLPALQRAVEPDTGIGVHALERRGAPTADRDWTYELRGDLNAELDAALREQALAIYQKLECKDFARADFRVDAEGRPWFLEINPLPTFAPDDTFAIAAELMDRDYVDFLSEVFARGFERLGLEG